jgi:hypothetical protein
VGKPEGKRPLGKPRRKWVHDIKIDLREIGNEASGSVKCWGKFLSSCTIGGFSRRAQLHEVSWFNSSYIPCGGRLAYLHSSPASRRTRRKGNPVPGAIIGLPSHWGT